MDGPTLAAGRDAARGFGSIAAARAVTHEEEKACDGTEDGIDLICCQGQKLGSGRVGTWGRRKTRAR